MTKKDALSILIESAKRDIAGSGMGYRSTSEEWRKKVKEAIKRIWNDVYSFPFDEKNIR